MEWRIGLDRHEYARPLLLNHDHSLLWGWAGRPVDDEPLEAVAKLREALRGDLGKQLCGHVTGREEDALRTRTVALLDNPVISTPDRRPIPWPAFLTVMCR